MLFARNARSTDRNLSLWPLILNANSAIHSAIKVVLRRPISLSFRAETGPVLTEALGHGDAATKYSLRSGAASRLAD